MELRKVEIAHSKAANEAVTAAVGDAYDIHWRKLAIAGPFIKAVAENAVAEIEMQLMSDFSGSEVVSPMLLMMIEDAFTRCAREAEEEAEKALWLEAARLSTLEERMPRSVRLDWGSDEDKDEADDERELTVEQKTLRAVKDAVAEILLEAFRTVAAQMVSSVAVEQGMGSSRSAVDILVEQPSVCPPSREADAAVANHQLSDDSMFLSASVAEGRRTGRKSEAQRVVSDLLAEAIGKVEELYTSDSDNEDAFDEARRHPRGQKSPVGDKKGPTSPVSEGGPMLRSEDGGDSVSVLSVSTDERKEGRRVEARRIVSTLLLEAITEGQSPASESAMQSARSPKCASESALSFLGSGLTSDERAAGRTDEARRIVSNLLLSAIEALPNSELLVDKNEDEVVGREGPSHRKPLSTSESFISVGGHMLTADERRAGRDSEARRIVSDLLQKVDEDATPKNSSTNVEVTKQAHAMSRVSSQRQPVLVSAFGSSLSMLSSNALFLPPEERRAARTVEAKRMVSELLFEAVSSVVHRDHEASQSQNKALVSPVGVSSSTSFRDGHWPAVQETARRLVSDLLASIITNRLNSIDDEASVATIPDGSTIAATSHPLVPTIGSADESVPPEMLARRSSMARCLVTELLLVAMAGLDEPMTPQQPAQKEQEEEMPDIVPPPIFKKWVRNAGNKLKSDKVAAGSTIPVTEVSACVADEGKQDALASVPTAASVTAPQASPANCNEEMPDIDIMPPPIFKRWVRNAGSKLKKDKQEEPGSKTPSQALTAITDDGKQGALTSASTVNEPVGNPATASGSSNATQATAASEEMPDIVPPPIFKKWVRNAGDKLKRDKAEQPVTTSQGSNVSSPVTISSEPHPVSPTL
eukprot:GILJ01019265.1.p1 GENE.GILJ01019265.1~~GILJ01019265.1.p1  ORF type:complete len:1008 (+),score=191.29 GILJ01019265.1:409-3024(+)